MSINNEIFISLKIKFKYVLSIEVCRIGPSAGHKSLGSEVSGLKYGSTLRFVWLWASNLKFASVRACEDGGHNHSNSPYGTIVS